MATILITGATDGIGRETARELAGRGYDLIVHGRSPNKLRDLVAGLESVAGHGRVDASTADLADLRQVRAMASSVTERFGPIDVLLHNAGVYMNEFARTPEGHETTWAVNVLAPFLLTHLLLPRVAAASDGGRVIAVSSIAHNRGSTDWAAADAPENFSPYSSYARSKLALTMAMVEFARRVGPKPIFVSLHPGVVSTKLLLDGFGMQGPDSLTEGAATSVSLASAPIEQLCPHQGGYFVRSRPAAMHPLARDPAQGAALHAHLIATLGIEPT